MPKPEAQAEAQLVVVGASAGGIEALSTLVSSLPADFPAPIVIAQHLDPRRPSHLYEILARRTALQVRSVADRETLENGVVYVVPSNRNVEISDHLVSVGDSANGGPMPSVDRLLASAAQAFGERLIAVILTGTGSDGAAGAHVVKQAGGTVVVQNPETASFPGMPMSLAPTTVDIVANLEAIGPLLVDLLTGVHLPRVPRDERTLETLLNQLRTRSGIDFSAYKQPTILRRLQRRLAATNSASLREYMRYLDRHPDEYQRLVGVFLIKVTEFFRDPQLFDFLREKELPTLIEDARKHGNELRLWSAGCATGEEAYSLAILVAELLGDELDQFHVRIFATDLDEDAVAFARMGVYPANSLSALPAETVSRYFSADDGNYEIKKFVRNLVIFGQHDLGQRAPFPRIDLALCRNVLIYFTSELQKRALHLFAFALRNGGLLVLGKAETVSPLAEFFSVEEPRLKIYRRYGDPVLIPPLRFKESSSITPMRLPRRRTLTRLGRAPVDADQEQRVPTSIDRAERLLFELPIGVALVDRSYDIQSMNGAARQMLGIYRSSVGEDLIHLVQRIPSEPLRAAIDGAFRGESVQLDEILAAQPTEEEPRFLRLTCTPHRGAGLSELVSVLIQDVTRETSQRKALEQRASEAQAAAERLSSRLHEVREINAQLQDANQELIETNSELTSTRDSFLIGNEEAQAAIEEVETLNEELQASNEELETLNEELQATVEELNTTNDDLEARTAELQDLAARLEAERGRLAAILRSIGDAVLVVDQAGTTIRTNTVYDELFGGGAVLLDREGNSLPEEETPQLRGARDGSFSMQFTLLEQDGTRRWFEANGQPVRGSAASLNVVVIRDITDRSLRALQDEFLTLAAHELRSPLTALRGYLEMLNGRLRRNGADEAVTRPVSQALAQAIRLTDLVNELMDVSRIQQGKLDLNLETIDLVPFVSQVVETSQPPATGRRIVLGTSAGPIEVQADRRRLEQILVNLLTNAVRFSPGADRIDVRVRRSGEEALIEVQDYGVGIAPADQPLVFNRFYQVQHPDSTAEPGLGLGLHLSQEIAAAHGGRIELTSHENEGSTFVLHLPRRQTQVSGHVVVSG